MHQPYKDPDPMRMETVETVADALTEVREYNRSCHPNDKINEDTFVLGAIHLFMGDSAPGGLTLAGLSGQIKDYASNSWR